MYVFDASDHYSKDSAILIVMYSVFKKSPVDVSTIEQNAICMNLTLQVV